MQPPRFDDLRTEPRFQRPRAEFLVPRIDAVPRDVLTQVVQQMPVVVQQRRGDEAVVLAGVARERGALQRMLKPSVTSWP